MLERGVAGCGWATFRAAKEDEFEAAEDDGVVGSAWSMSRVRLVLRPFYERGTRRTPEQCDGVTASTRTCWETFADQRGRGKSNDLRGEATAWLDVSWVLSYRTATSQMGADGLTAWPWSHLVIARHAIHSSMPCHALPYRRSGGRDEYRPGQYSTRSSLASTSLWTPVEAAEEPQRLHRPA